MLSIPNVMLTVGDMAEETTQRVRRKSSKKGGSCAIQHPKNELNSLLFLWVYGLPRSSPKVFTPDAGYHDLRRDITTQLCLDFTAEAAVLHAQSFGEN